MNFLRLVFRSVHYYWRKHLTVMSGTAIAMAVLTGALMVGDTMSWNLEEMVNLRLGTITHAVNSGDRFMTAGLAEKIEKEGVFPVAPVMQLQGMLIAGGESRLNKVEIIGVDDSFGRVTGAGSFFDDLGDNETIISRNIADRMDLKAGDEILLMIRKASLVPMNAPFVADDGGSISARMKIRAIADDSQMGRYTLRVTQALPLNVFVSLRGLNRMMDTGEKANTLVLSTDKSKEEIENLLKKNWSLQDAQLSLRRIADSYSLVSERVFIEPYVVSAAASAGRGQLILTYFVNSLQDGQRCTPYSFVSTLPDEQIGKNEVIISGWLAEDLKAKKGDSLEMSYFTVGLLRELAVDSAKFMISNIVDMEGEFADRSLMPEIPGLSDAGSCRDWDTGIPVDLKKIRDKDEDYWEKYRGTPKAYIAYSRAVDLWENRFGSCTDIRFSTEGRELAALEQKLNSRLEPAELGITVNEVKSKGKKAAGEGVDFSQLFIGLSFFVLVAAVILIILLFFLNLDGRKEQVQTLSALGFTEKKIRSLLISEQMIVSVPGIFAGIFMAVLYNKFVFGLLNSLWGDIVRTELIRTVVRPQTLVIGGLITMLLIYLTLAFALRRYLTKGRIKGKVANERSSRFHHFFTGILIFLPGLISLLLISWQLLRKEAVMPSVFFLAGGLLLLTFLFAAINLLKGAVLNRAGNSSLVRLATSNVSRNPGRSIGVIALFSLGAFLVITTGANRQDLFKGANDPHSGTGGYKWFAESSVPVLKDLNKPAVKADLGLDSCLSFVQFRRAEGDDASCLNLNRISQPGILATNPGLLEGHFSFVSALEMPDPDKPWAILDSTLPSGLVPAIADETVIKWGLGMVTGDTLHYTGSHGESMDLLLVAGLAGSVFQGSIILSEKSFLKYYPDHSGTSVFLINYTGDDAADTEAILRSSMRDYGWNMEDAALRLATFKSVTNTYLSIFMAMGALALMLGTVGLAIVLLRTIQERRSEISLLRAVGYRRKNILVLIVTEFLLLLLGGIMIGSLTAIISTLPSLLSPNTGVSAGAISNIILLLLFNGIFWLLLFSLIAVRKKTDASSLRNE